MVGIDNVRHDCPVHRRVTAYLPDNRVELTRRNVESLMDDVLQAQGKFDDATSKALSESLNSYTVKKQQTQEARRINDLTERVDLAEFYAFREDDSHCLLVRPCITGCPHHLDGPGRHKLWVRICLAQLDQENNPTHRPVTDLDIGDLVDFYQTADVTGRAVTEQVWKVFERVAAEAINGLSYSETDIKRLTINVDETQDEHVYQANSALRYGRTLKDVLEDENGGGKAMFQDIIKVVEGKPKAGLDLGNIKEFMMRDNVEILGFAPPSAYDFTYFVKVEEPDQKNVRLVGTSYAKGIDTANDDDLSSRLSFVAGRDLMTLRGGEIF